MSVTTEDLKAALANFTGTEMWYRHPLNPNLLYTDGVREFAELAGAYWFLDIVATEIFEIQELSEFLCIVLHSDDMPRIVADDGNGNKLYFKALDFTDCPRGDWKFYLVNSTLLLPGEY